MSDDVDEDDDEALSLHREVAVPPLAAGMRLDRFLAARFPDRSRSEFAKAIKAGLIANPAVGTLWRASQTVREGDVLHVLMAGIAPPGPPPPFPPVLYEDERVVAIHKPAGMMAHPAGTRFVWAVVGLARTHFDNPAVDIVHRLDKDTSGILLLTKDREANAWLKAVFVRNEARKHYLAIVKGSPDWETLSVDAPIGRADGLIRIQMAVRPDGLPARTDFTVVARHPTAPWTLLRCRLHTGRTHQIRVHLAHVGLPILGDLLYGVPPEVFLEVQETGLTAAHQAITGARRHALHAAHLTFPHPDGGERTVDCPLPDDLAAWWADPATALPEPDPEV